MKYQLINKDNNKNYKTIETVLLNRKIPYQEINHYLHSTDLDISNPELLGEEKLKNAATILIKHIYNNDKIIVIVDCDCDGFTSSALLINYLHDLFPAFVENNILFFFHEGKEHGLSDFIKTLNNIKVDYNLVLVPDAGSNDTEYHKMLFNENIDVIVLDHHIVENNIKDIENHIVVINNQNSDYPNKFLSGVGIVWQFCRYLDKLLKKNNANQYLDLVALGLTGDMMSLTSIETKHLINKGFEDKNILNPYIYEMWQKNKFKIGEHINSIDAAFYIVPMINAVQRSGTMEEKILLFNSFLKHKAFELIDSTKRGHKGEQEKLIEQAVRMSTNVKNRQTREQDKMMEELEILIEKNNLLKHKVILFTLDKNSNINRNIAGLIANKIANKYQRPCCILSETENKNIILSNLEEKECAGFSENIEKNKNIEYQGSARGYEATGIMNFKTICENSGAEWCQGHENAFGMCLMENKIETFLEETDKALENISNEPIYYVDFIYRGCDINYDDIIAIANMKSFWGKDFEEPYIAIEKLKVSKNMVTVYKKNSNTLKITLPNKINLIKFNISDEECFKLENYNGEYVELNIVGRCSINEFLGNKTAQILIEDYDILRYGKFLF